MSDSITADPATADRTATVTIPAGFNGPPTTANGGFACGLIAGRAAALLHRPVAVSLLQPPPLGVPLDLHIDGRRMHVWSGVDLIASAVPTAAAIDVVPPVSWAEAVEAQDRFAGDAFHPFPSCVVCGPKRDGKPGLFLRPGYLPGQPDTVACSWAPPEWLAPTFVDRTGAVSPEMVWAVLDCPGGWTADPARQTMVLGRMAAQIDASPRLGGRYVVVGRRTAAEERTATNLTALYDADGTLLARASATWIALNR